MHYSGKLYSEGTDIGPATFNQLCHWIDSRTDDSDMTPMIVDGVPVTLRNAWPEAIHRATRAKFIDSVPEPHRTAVAGMDAMIEEIRLALELDVSNFGTEKFVNRAKTLIADLRAYGDRCNALEERNDQLQRQDDTLTKARVEFAEVVERFEACARERDDLIEKLRAEEEEHARVRAALAEYENGKRATFNAKDVTIQIGERTLGTDLFADMADLDDEEDEDAREDARERLHTFEEWFVCIAEFIPDATGMLDDDLDSLLSYMREEHDYSEKEPKASATLREIRDALGLHNPLPSAIVRLVRRNRADSEFFRQRIGGMLGINPHAVDFRLDVEHAIRAMKKNPLRSGEVSFKMDETSRESLRKFVDGVLHSPYEPLQGQRVDSVFVDDVVEHECKVEPTSDPNWGKCEVCDDATFPLTEEAAKTPTAETESTPRDFGSMPLVPPVSVIKRAIEFHGSGDDRVFNAANYSRAYVEFFGGGESLSGDQVRAILASTPDVEVLAGGAHFRHLVPKPSFVEPPPLDGCALPLASLKPHERCGACGLLADRHREWHRTQEARNPKAKPWEEEARACGWTPPGRS